MPGRTFDRNLPVLKEVNIPYYVQIYDIIYQLIQDGSLQEGDALPGENLLADYWKVSRGTVRTAIRKLEEDGYIYKMQGKKTTVTGQYARNKDGLHKISNPCTTSCINPVTRIDSKISIQNGGRLIGNLLGYGDTVFTVVTVDIKYYSDHTPIASSVAIIPIARLEKKGIAIDEEEKIKEFVVSGMYKSAQRSSLSMSVVERRREDGLEPGPESGLECETGILDQPNHTIVVVMDEVLYENEEPAAYHKYRMDSNWYRFTLERKSFGNP